MRGSPPILDPDNGAWGPLRLYHQNSKSRILGYITKIVKPDFRMGVLEAISSFYPILDFG
jgi:hypothetical protein